MKTLLLIISTLLVNYAYAGPARNPSNITVDCSDRERMDRAALEMTIYGDRDHVMPLTDAAALSDHCPRLKAAELVVKAYSRQCFKPFPQQVIGMLVKGNAQELKKRCSTPEGRAEFVGYAQCTPQINWDAAHTCMDTYIRQLEATRDTVTDLDKKLPYTCCYFHKFKKCVSRQYRKVCSDAASDYTENMISGTVNDALDLTCTNHEEGNPNCDKLLKDEALTLKATKSHTSYLQPLVDIYTNL